MGDVATLRLGAVALFFSIGCAQPPDHEIEIASDRIERARSADADVFAPGRLEDAEESLAAARTLTTERSYLAAVHAAGDAVTHADEAAVVAVVEKQYAMRQSDRCLRELEGLIAIARSRGADTEAPDELADFERRVAGVKATAERGELLTVLEQGRYLKPELLAFEQRFRN